MKMSLSWMMAAAIGLALMSSFFVVDDGDCASVWEAASVGVGGQGVWVDEGGVPAFRDVEAIGRGAISLTPHISVVGGVGYGVSNSYVRGSGGIRLTATDVENKDFSVGVGVSRHYTSEPLFGLDEAAAEGAVGWKPLTNSSVIVTALAAVGLDTGRRVFSAGIIVPFHLGGN